MSAVEDDPQHLVRWCRAQGHGRRRAARSCPAETYGRYLADAARRDAGPGRVARSTRVRDEAVDVTDTGTRLPGHARLRCGAEADVVVLALGNPPPRRPRGLDVDADRLVADPWAPGLLDRVGEDDRVLLVGTGLTTVDVAAQVAAARPARPDHRDLAARGCCRCGTSRSRPGRRAAFDGDVRTLRAVLARGPPVRRATATTGAAWWSRSRRSPTTCGPRLSREDREQFSRHVARHWEIARHRMAPAMAAMVDDLLATGRLTVPPSSAVDAAAYDLVVNCTGPAPVSSPAGTRSSTSSR